MFPPCLWGRRRKPEKLASPMFPADGAGRREKARNKERGGKKADFKKKGQETGRTADI